MQKPVVSTRRRVCVPGMELLCHSSLRLVLLSGWLGFAGAPFLMDAAPRALHPEITVSPAGHTDLTGFVQLKHNPKDGHLYMATDSGKVFRLAVTNAGPEAVYELVYTTADHGLVALAGMAFDHQGTLFLTANRTEGKRNIATIVRGRLNGLDGLQRSWTVLAETEPYPLSGGGFNHKVNGAVVSPDDQFLFVNSGSRTDHGEISDNSGAFPGLRETGLTAIILRVPTSASQLVLPNDRETLRAQGLLFAEGFRNAFSLNFAPNGQLFGTENSADRDNPEELNWIREGHHYGFPWRMGNTDNPQRFPDYDPSKDLLLNPAYSAVRGGTYTNDPTYPAAPAVMDDPILNLGPDANKYRDPLTGHARDAALDGISFGTFTAHRSPLGLVFDAGQSLSPEFRGDAFVTCYTHGNLDDGREEEGPFLDPGEDILHIDLINRGDRYVLYSERVAAGLSSPVDSVLVGNRMFVLQYFKGTNLWSFTFPTESHAAPGLKLESGVGPAGRPKVSVNSEPGKVITVEWSDDLNSWWTGIRQVVVGNGPVVYDDVVPLNRAGRYYRAWQR